jgi:hypothetical protein
MHLTLASALLRVMHLAQSHSPGLGLNISASDGNAEEAVAGAASFAAAAAFVPNENEAPPALPPPPEGAGAPGLGSSHDMHLTLASALLRVMHLAQSHSPGLGLNMSASDGSAEEAAWPFAAGAALLRRDLAGAAATSGSSASISPMSFLSLGSEKT